MDRPSVAGHGMWSRQLPPGFRFHPTDEELVLQYLKKKVYSCPLPASIIPDIDISKFDPWDLPSFGNCTCIFDESTNQKEKGNVKCYDSVQAGVVKPGISSA